MILSALATAIDRHSAGRSGEDGPCVTPIPGLRLLRAERPMPARSPMRMVYTPAMCLVAQGTKRGTFGETVLEYSAGQAGIVGIETPGAGRVVRGSAEQPFLAAVVDFDVAVVREVFERLPCTPPTSGARSGPVFIVDVGNEVAASVLRLVELLDKPDAISIVAPGLMRELSYWLLTGPSGGDVAAVVLGADRSEHVVAAVQHLRERFAEPIRIRDLARTAGMSSAQFHRVFKATMSMTPLQYQKQLRLLHARGLMLGNGVNAETAAYRVGYESASQFSREYVRMFGAPPRRDTIRARMNVVRSTAVAGSASP